MCLYVLGTTWRTPFGSGEDSLERGSFERVWMVVLNNLFGSLTMFLESLIYLLIQIIDKYQRTMKRFMNLRWNSERTKSFTYDFFSYTFLAWLRNTVSSYHRLLKEYDEFIKGFPLSNSASRFAIDWRCFYSLYITI